MTPPLPGPIDGQTPPLRIALPKGRLMKRALALFGTAGLLDAETLAVGRRLVVPVPAAPGGLPLELLLLKNADVPTYVEHGVAECGICGTDVLDEARADVYRPHTFAFGRCAIALAAREGTTLGDLRSRDGLRIATKYTTIARAWFASRGWPAELIELSGSVELGAVLGLSDAIVDLVETGNTLRENQLVVLETIGATQVKLVTNRALSRERVALVEALIGALVEAELQQAAEAASREER